MAGYVHAFGIIAIPLLTIFLVIKYGRRPIKIKQAFWGLFSALALSFILKNVTRYKCGAGAPFFQWIIPSICLFFIILFVQPFKVRLLTSICFIIASFLLSFQFVYLIHTKKYASNPVYAIEEKAKKTILSIVCNILLEEAEANNTYFPEGWLRDSLSSVNNRKLMRLINKNFYFPVFHMLWHTKFTGLYEKKYAKMDIWYPGGLPKTSSKKIRFKKWFDKAER